MYVCNKNETHTPDRTFQHFNSTRRECSQSHIEIHASWDFVPIPTKYLSSVLGSIGESESICSGTSLENADNDDQLYNHVLSAATGPAATSRVPQTANAEIILCLTLKPRAQSITYCSSLITVCLAYLVGSDIYGGCAVPTSGTSPLPFTIVPLRRSGLT